MKAAPRNPPFGLVWLSSSLYRERTDPDLFLGELAAEVDRLGGTPIEIDGWDDALSEAWRKLVERPPVREWVASYVDRRGDEGLTVTFGDTTRVVGRRGHENFDVSYPADLLLADDDKVSAMRAAILLVLDRHVDRRRLGVPLLSVVVDAN